MSDNTDRPKSSDDHNERLRAIAHARLDELFDQARRARLWGITGIELTWENGVVRLIHRRLEGRDKA